LLGPNGPHFRQGIAFDHWARIKPPMSGSANTGMRRVRASEVLQPEWNGIPPVYLLIFQAVRRSAAVTQFDISMAIVIGPTPPGTGVMAAQRSATAS